MKYKTALCAVLSGTCLIADSDATISFLITGDTLRDSAGAAVDFSSGLALLVADTAADGFGAVLPSSVGAGDIVNGADDTIVWKGDFTTFATDGVVNANPTGLNLGGGWDSGDPLALYWFPTGGPAAASVAGGDPYGFYTSVTGQDGSDPWITPTDGTLNHTLTVLTASNSGFFGAGTVPDGSTASALRVAIPEPAAASFLLLTGGLCLARRRRR